MHKKSEYVVVVVVVVVAAVDRFYISVILRSRADSLRSHVIPCDFDFSKTDVGEWGGEWGGE